MPLESNCLSDDAYVSGEIGVARLSTLKIHIRTLDIICHS